MRRPILCKSNDIRTTVEIMTNDLGKRCKLIIKRIKSSKLKLMQISDVSARWIGYESKADFMAQSNLSQYANEDIYLDPSSEKIYLLKQITAYCLN